MGAFPWRRTGRWCTWAPASSCRPPSCSGSSSRPRRRPSGRSHRAAACCRAACTRPCHGRWARGLRSGAPARTWWAPRASRRGTGSSARARRGRRATGRSAWGGPTSAASSMATTTTTAPRSPAARRRPPSPAPGGQPARRSSRRPRTGPEGPSGPAASPPGRPGSSPARTPRRGWRSGTQQGARATSCSGCTACLRTSDKARRPIARPRPRPPAWLGPR
mmetsp:Transcript_57687/g.162662  ORF Transcript_57687/g.162662 Transcript_57687/m.162662 type:complete len:220 (+) Transcript_57687:1237-1896(+)